MTLQASSRRPPGSATRLRDDDGSTLLLTIFYGFLALVLILLVVAATSLYLERKRLFSLADGAALVGAEAFALDAVALTPQGPRPVLHSADVAGAVNEYLLAVPGNSLHELVVERAESVDGESATVELSAYWRPPLLSLLVPDGIRIDATSVARSVFS
ncbi:MAG: pilus assembly protein TadG-related protein [Terrimesophilobacter sp.]